MHRGGSWGHGVVYGFIGENLWGEVEVSNEAFFEHMKLWIFKYLYYL